MRPFWFAPHAPERAPQAANRCGIDSLEIARMERLLRDTPPEDLRKLFSAQELQDSEPGPRRPASLAARFAAKEACLKLFPRETALGTLQPADFSVVRDSYGAPQAVCSPGRPPMCSPAIASKRFRSRSHTIARPPPPSRSPSRCTPRCRCPGRLLYRLLPYRRKVVRDNMRRVFGETIPEHEITTSRAGALCAHLAADRGVSLVPSAADVATGQAGSGRERDVLRRAHARARACCC